MSLNLDRGFYPIDLNGKITIREIVETIIDLIEDGGGGSGGTITVGDITDASDIGKTVMKAADGVAIRTAIGAGTSNLKVGTTASEAKAGNWNPKVDDVSDASTVGKSVMKATDATAARTAIGAGTSNLKVGTAVTDAKAGNWNPSNVTTSTAGLMLSADKVKLDGIAAGSTKNDTDANLKNRANHTGSQAISTVTGLQALLDAKATATALSELAARVTALETP